MIVMHESKKLRLANLWKILKLFMPPVIFKAANFVKHRFGKATLEYAPEGWKTRFDNHRNQGWNVCSFVETEKGKWDDFRRNLEGPAPLGFSHEHTDMSVIRNPYFHNVHISYAYVLALAAQKKDRISVLDWGGALGHYFLVGKAVLPDVLIEYHVKEIPLMCKAGKKLNPEIRWHNDESCLEREYDLIMMNGSIGYIEEWVDLLQRIARSTKKYLFLFRLLVVQNSPSFLSIERLYDSRMLHQQFNQTELLEKISKIGLTLVREFVLGERPFIRGAPEQCEMRGWLFKKEPVL